MTDHGTNSPGVRNDSLGQEGPDLDVADVSLLRPPGAVSATERDDSKVPSVPGGRSVSSQEHMCANQRLAGRSTAAVASAEAWACCPLARTVHCDFQRRADLPHSFIAQSTKTLDEDGD